MLTLSLRSWILRLLRSSSFAGAALFRALVCDDIFTQRSDKSLSSVLTSRPSTLTQAVQGCRFTSPDSM